MSKNLMPMFLMPLCLVAVTATSCGVEAGGRGAKLSGFSDVLAMPDAADDVSVSRSGNRYLATLAGSAAKNLRASLKNPTYASPQGGLKISCSASEALCRLTVDSSVRDLSNVHLPSDGGNTDLLQVWLTGDVGKEFYLNQTSVKERFIADDLGLKTYEKQVLQAKSKDASVSLECFRKSVPQLVVFRTSRYECALNLSGFRAR